jgi:prepilin peptidase CpaA
MPLLCQVVLMGLVFAAGVYDMRYRRIPNWLVAAGLALGFALNIYLLGWAGLKAASLGLGFAFLVYFPLYLLRGMGAGDVKLMMAIGALAGPLFWFGIFVATGILGGCIAIILLLARGRLKKTLWNVGFLLHRAAHLEAPFAYNPELDVRSSAGMRLPHGAVIALATVVFLGLSRVFVPA